MKKFLLILVVIVAFGAIVMTVAVKKAKEKKSSFNQQYFDSKQQNQDNQLDVDAARDQLTKDVKNSKEFVGVIRTTSDPVGKDVRFFLVEADVINLEEIGNVDFARKAPELPMTKQTFKVAVDASTDVKGADDKEDIESGDMIRIKSGSSIYETTEFTATEIQLVARRQ